MASNRPSAIRDLESDYPPIESDNGKKEGYKMAAINLMFRNKELETWVTSVGHAMLRLRSEKDRSLFGVRFKLIINSAI